MKTKSKTVEINGKLINLPTYKRKLTKADIIFICAMLIGPLVFFAVFWVYVNISSIFMAFQIPTGEWSLLSMKIVFKSLGEGGSDLQIAIRNTLIYFAISIITIPFHVIISYFLYRKVKGFKFFQICFYLPSIISTLVICQMFQDFIQVDGPLGKLLMWLGMAEENIPFFLKNSDYAMKTMVIYTLWIGWGGHMLLLGGALARTPVEILESGRIDGVNTGQELIYMVFPLLWPTISTFIILALTGILTASGPILAMTKGAYQTTTISYWIYDKLYFSGTSAYNEVSAMGLVFTCVGVPIILFIKWLIEKIPVTEY